MFDPIACTATILTFLGETEHMVPDPTGEERIEKVTGKLRELKQKAAAPGAGQHNVPKEASDPESPQRAAQ